MIIVHGLSREQLAALRESQLGGRRQRLAEQKIGLELPPAAKQFLAAEGYDPVYGAWPVSA